MKLSIYTFLSLLLISGPGVWAKPKPNPQPQGGTICTGNIVPTLGPDELLPPTTVVSTASGRTTTLVITPTPVPLAATTGSGVAAGATTGVATTGATSTAGAASAGVAAGVGSRPEGGLVVAAAALAVGLAAFAAGV